jgi:hypothetical protein
MIMDRTYECTAVGDRLALLERAGQVLRLGIGDEFGPYVVRAFDRGHVVLRDRTTLDRIVLAAGDRIVLPWWQARRVPAQQWRASIRRNIRGSV